jgi:uncharacterized protein YjbI with pentapeptide repeats
MKVIKPGRLGVLTRCYERERQFHMGVSVLAFVPLGHDELGPIMLSEIDMWKFAARALAGGPLDSAIPKARGEFLVVGKAYAPGGEPVPGFPVRAHVGGLTKDAEVHGDRTWRKMLATAAQPIAEMPLDWAHAYGGPAFAKNPLGKGHAEIKDGGLQHWPLPNIEDPNHRIVSPRDRPEPICFGPIDISWPQRSALAGTYDKFWLENLYPGFARDIDWGIHNIAQRDQQREGAWAGGDPYRFENMHPTRVVHGALPRVRARVLVSRSHAPGQPRPSFNAVKDAARRPPAALEEVDLALQTLWFFPDAERAVLIWQGSTRVAEEDGADIVHLLVAAEHDDRARPREYYMTALAARLDPEWGLLACMAEHELLPEGLASLPDQPPDEDQQLCATEGFTRQNLHRRAVREAQKARDIVAAEGLDPDVHGPPLPQPPSPPPKLHELPGLVTRLQAEARAKQTEHEVMAAVKLAEAEQDVDQARIPGFEGKALREEVNAKGVGPPKFSAAVQRATLEAIAMDCRRHGYINDEVEDMLADRAMYAQWQEAERAMVENYRLQAHYQEPAPPMPPELREPTRERVRLAIARGEDFATLNFTGADLRGMDLRGADMTGALLESADLTGADLRGCKLVRAVLAHARLTEARLDDAALARANLGKAALERTVLTGADLRDAILVGTRFDGADLQRATVTGAMIKDARLDRVDARGLVGDRLNFIDVTLAGVNFGGATLSGSTFMKMDLRGASFAGAALEGCVFLECEATKIEFTGARLNDARFVNGCKLDGAQMSGASLARANLRGTSLQAANLREAVLDGADLCECNLSQAKLGLAVAVEARFEVSDLRGAEFLSANLMGASLARATIYGADMRDANLHGVDMARVRRDGGVRLDEALMTKVRVHPRHVEPEPKERRR